MTDFPKAQFKYIANTYAGAVAMGMDPGNLNRDRADTLLRELGKTEWLLENKTAYRLWTLGGDPWFQFIKDLGAYTKEVRNYERQIKKEAAQAQRDADRAARAAAKTKPTD